MATSKSAEVSAQNFIEGKNLKPKVASLVLADVDIEGARVPALCSYGAHFPVLVRMPDGSILHNPDKFDGAEYQNALALSGFGYGRRRTPKSSPTTNRHVHAAYWTLKHAGYVKVDGTIECGDYALDRYVKA